MKERPILFSGPMVRALLAGTKTQTRRIVKPQPPEWAQHVNAIQHLNVEPRWVPSWLWQWSELEQRPLRKLRRWPTDKDGDGFDGYAIPCPHGRPGEQLWVRETWAKLLHTSPATDEPHLCDGDKLIEHATRRANGKGWNYDGEVIAYRATSDVEFCDGDGFSGDQANRDDMPRWKPSIHMRREYSRITLEITSVRVERLQAISEADAKAEGVEASVCGPAPWMNYLDPNLSEFTAHNSYATLWESIHGYGSWALNPWVWVVESKRMSA